MLARIADFSFRRKWLVVLVWIAVAVGATVAAGSVGGEWKSSARLDGTDAQRAYDLFEKHFPSQSGLSASVVFEVRDRGIASKKRAIGLYLTQIAKEPGIAQVVSPFDAPEQIAADGTIGFAQVDFASDDSDMMAASEAMKERATDLRAAGVTTEFSGELFSEGELPATEVLGLLAAAVILFLTLGSLVGAGLPLLTAILGIVTGLASVSLWAALVDTPDFTVQVASMIGIGVGIDYSLFIVTRFREARARNLSVHSAVLEAANTAGRAVVFAGLTVMVSLLGMILMRIRFLNGLAVGSSTAVAIAVVAAITLLPALLGIVGHRIRPANVAGRHGHTSIWVRWSKVVQSRPWASAGAGLIVLLAFGMPTLALRLGSADEGSRPKEQTTRKAYDLLAKGFTPGSAGPFVMITETPSDESQRALMNLVKTVRQTEGVAFVSDPIPDANQAAAIIRVVPTTSPQDPATGRLLRQLRDDVLPSATRGTDLAVSVGGATASSVDFAYFIGQRLPYFIGAVLVISFLLLTAMFRSVLVPLKAVVLNLLSIGAAYGVMVAVFQWAWLGSLFGVGRGAPIEPWAPMMLFAIVFGLSMDYEVFLLSKIRENFDATLDNSDAVANGVASTARVITAAAAIMVFVFGFFVFGDSREIKLIGLGLATAVLIDATVVRLLLVPATMELMGSRNWWMPKWLDRVVPHLDVEGGHAHYTDGTIAVGHVDRIDSDHAHTDLPLAHSGALKK